MRDANELFFFQDSLKFLISRLITFNIQGSTQKDTYGLRRIGFTTLRGKESLAAYSYLRSGLTKYEFVSPA